MSRLPSSDKQGSKNELNMKGGQGPRRKRGHPVLGDRGTWSRVGPVGKEFRQSCERMLMV